MLGGDLKRHLDLRAIGKYLLPVLGFLIAVPAYAAKGKFPAPVSCKLALSELITPNYYVALYGDMMHLRKRDEVVQNSARKEAQSLMNGLVTGLSPVEITDAEFYFVEGLPINKFAEKDQIAATEQSLRPLKEKIAVRIAKRIAKMNLTAAEVNDADPFFRILRLVGMVNRLYETTGDVTGLSNREWEQLLQIRDKYPEIVFNLALLPGARAKIEPKLHEQGRPEEVLKALRQRVLPSKGRRNTYLLKLLAQTVKDPSLHNIERLIWYSSEVGSPSQALIDYLSYTGVPVPVAGIAGWSFQTFSVLKTQRMDTTRRWRQVREQALFSERSYQIRAAKDLFAVGYSAVEIAEILSTPDRPFTKSGIDLFLEVKNEDFVRQSFEGSYPSWRQKPTQEDLDRVLSEAKSADEREKQGLINYVERRSELLGAVRKLRWFGFSMVEIADLMNKNGIRTYKGLALWSKGPAMKAVRISREDTLKWWATQDLTSRQRQADFIVDLELENSSIPMIMQTIKDPLYKLKPEDIFHWSHERIFKMLMERYSNVKIKTASPYHRQ